jgi:hypothetical protein
MTLNLLKWLKEIMEEYNICEFASWGVVRIVKTAVSQVVALLCVPPIGIARHQIHDRFSPHDALYGAIVVNTYRV